MAAGAEAAPADVAAGAWRAVFHGKLGQLALGLLALEFVSAIQSFTISTTLPAVTLALHGRRWYGFATTAMVLASIVAAPFAAPLTDRFGLRRVLNVATPAYVLGAAGAALAPSMAVFVGARCLQGAASATMAVFGLSAVASQFPPAQRRRMMSLMSSMWIVPALIGPPYAAFATELVGWRVALALPVPLLLGARLLIARRITEYHGDRARRLAFPLRRAVMLGVGVVVFLSGSGSPDALGLVCAVAGLGLAAVGLHGLFPAGTLRARRGPQAAVAAMTVLCFAFYGAESLVTLMATADLGTSLTQAGLALTVGAVCRSCASLLQPKLLEHRRLGPARTASAGALLLALVLGLLLLDVRGHGSSAATLPLLWSCWALGGFAMGLCYTPVSLAALDAGEDSDGEGGARAASAAGSALVLAETVGGLVGMSAGGLLASMAQGAAPGGHTLVPFAFFAACALPLAALTARIQRPRPAPS